MKSLFILMILAFGMLLVMPPGNEAKASVSDQTSFVVNHQNDVVVNDVIVAVVAQDYVVYAQENSQYVSTDCREGGGVEVQVLNLVTQPTNRITHKVTRPDFTKYCRYDSRLCRYSMQYNLRTQNTWSSHRFARDGLTKV